MHASYAYMLVYRFYMFKSNLQEICGEASVGTPAAKEYERLLKEGYRTYHICEVRCKIV